MKLGKEVKKGLLALLLFLGSTSVFSWTPNGGITQAVEIITYENRSEIIFKTASGYFCYIPVDKEYMHAIVLSSVLAISDVVVYCHDETDRIGTYDAHKLHRFTIKQ